METADTTANASWREPDGSGMALYSEGDVLFDAMLSDIREARQRVWLESYIFATDEIGRIFVEELAECAARGVDVLVRVDAVGSQWGFSGSSARRLGGSGAHLKWWQPWHWQRPRVFQRRNHRKLLIVDERVAYLGGFNISAVSSRRFRGPARWRDTHVRLRGPIVTEAAAAFAAFSKGEADWSGDETRPVYMASNHGRHCRYQWRCLLERKFCEARERIWLTTPYFVPDSMTQRNLCAAAVRGVDARILVPAKSDVRLVQWAGRASYSKLLRSGVRIFEYQPRTLHAKTLLVDHDWATVGTANFDYRSFFINYELNLIAQSRNLNAALTALFQDDLFAAQEIRTRPWGARPLFARLAELVGWGARRWL